MAALVPKPGRRGLDAERVILDPLRPMRPKSILITGASSGIGRAIAFEYASGGARIAIAARRADRLAEVAREIETRGGRAVSIVVDVTEPEAAKDAVLRADSELGGLDMVIANAGSGKGIHATKLQWADVNPILDLNVSGAFATLIAAIPIMVAQGSGHLVGITSLAGRRALPKSAAYCASKAALSTFLESLRIDLAASGVRVTDVQPGFVETEIARGGEPLPFLWSADRAARVIARRLERAPATIAFPWPLATLTAFSRYLPAWIYDRVIRMGAGTNKRKALTSANAG
jgi:NADP-dependent 3-hydroxy acid dehydrogenase YdfG